MILFLIFNVFFSFNFCAQAALPLSKPDVYIGINRLPKPELE